VPRVPENIGWDVSRVPETIGWDVSRRPDVANDVIGVKILDLLVSIPLFLFQMWVRRKRERVLFSDTL